ncbi:MAG: ATP-binding protein [Candidatus Omnitrophica bacterium]|jgi:serine/threonine-protein kinase RsbW|nr:ATP-binding protein [Candidatus Omnitrophota bacterium]
MNNIKFFSKKSQSIAEIRTKITEYIKSFNAAISEDVLFDIRLCLEEALRNAMMHGNKMCQDLQVNVSYNIENDELVISIQDEGEGFDPGSLPDPTKDENLYEDHGRGVFIMKKFMDSVEYNEKGNKVVMRKKLI